MIKLLMVDDSETELAILKSIFKKEPSIQIVGVAKDGAEAVRLVPLLKPDIITMDIQMPVMDGLEATRLIMSQNPTPIVVISSAVNKDTLDLTFQALEAGALSVIAKPINIGSSSFIQASKRISDLICSMAQIKVITKRFHFKKKFIKEPIVHAKRLQEKTCSLIAIGASVGGPQALKLIFSQLPKDFPVPILVVQHMTPGFVHAFASWLNDQIDLTVKIALDGELIEKGHIYFAPDNFHLEIKERQNEYYTQLLKGNPIAGFCPSITALLNSIANVCGTHALGVLLTGMGSDGVEGLLALRKAGGHTIIQDEKSAVVFGMAGVARAINAVDETVALSAIAEYLINAAKH